MNVAIGIIDMQEIFLRSIDPNAREKMIQGQKHLLHYAVDTGTRVFLIEYETLWGDSASANTISPLTEIWNTQSVELRHWIRKRGDDAFHGTDLSGMLKEYDVDYFGLVGVNASGCLLRTAYSAIREGYLVGTSLDMIADPPRRGGPIYLDESERVGKWFKDHVQMLPDYSALTNHFEVLKGFDSVAIQKERKKLPLQ